MQCPKEIPRRKCSECKQVFRSLFSLQRLNSVKYALPQVANSSISKTHMLTYKAEASVCPLLGAKQNYKTINALRRGCANKALQVSEA